MRIQFVVGYNPENTIDINIERIPEKWETEAIENEIYNALDIYEQENGSREGFDYWGQIYKIVEKYIPIAENPIVTTIYI